jgi:DNA-binding CsgD family transcriptional regulator
VGLAGAEKSAEDRQTRGSSPPCSGLPGTGHSTEARFAKQVKALPCETRTALLLVAAEPTGDPTTIGIAANTLGISLTSLEPAEANHLVRTHPRLEFSSSIVRSAVCCSASLALRREVHLALASAIDRVELRPIGERRTRPGDGTATDLTPRESEIARLAAIRLTSREIASQLFISPHTVEYHLRKIFQKLGVGSRRDLATAMEVL